jgi:hypothetical protein
VEQALGDVHQAVALDTESIQPFEQPIEVTALRFVRADVLGGHDCVEAIELAHLLPFPCAR